MGLFQINLLAHPWARELDLTNPMVNAAAARRVYDAQGYGAWKWSAEALGLLGGDTGGGVPASEGEGMDDAYYLAVLDALWGKSDNRDEAKVAAVIALLRENHRDVYGLPDDPVAAAEADSGESRDFAGHRGRCEQGGGGRWRWAGFVQPEGR